MTDLNDWLDDHRSQAFAGLTDDDYQDEDAIVLPLPSTGTGGSNPDAQPSTTVFEILPWDDLLSNTSEEVALVEGVVYPGRWCNFVAKAKAGKSTLIINIATDLARGQDPFDHHERPPVNVLYLDGEMGRLDMRERVRRIGLSADDLRHLHYTDLITSSLNSAPGGGAVQAAARQLGAEVVILDGLNSFVSGDENDAATWLGLYEHTIAPLKRADVAIITADNTGKDTKRGARGSSVKTDKADAEFRLHRVENGIKLDAERTRRSAIFGADISLRFTDDKMVRYERTTRAWPAGTDRVVKLLDDLGLPADASRRVARDTLTPLVDDDPNSDEYRVGDHLLQAAVNFRKRYA